MTSEGTRQDLFRNYNTQRNKRGRIITNKIKSRVYFKSERPNSLLITSKFSVTQVVSVKNGRIAA